MAELAGRHRAVHLDVGTGDGAYVLRSARLAPDVLHLGVDASAEGLRDASRRIAAKPARGGLSNALLGVLPLEKAPGELAGLADVLTVLLPWGSLLRAVALPDPAALLRLRGLCRPGAELRVLFGHGPTDAAVLPPLDAAHRERLPDLYRAAGLAVRARLVPRDEVGELPTTWARKLAFSSSPREFLELRGHALPDPVAP